MHPEQYTGPIETHAQRDQAKYLHAGANYVPFALFLKSAGAPVPAVPVAVQHVCLIVHSVHTDGRRTADCYRTDELQRHNVTTSEDPGSLRIFFLRGHVSPQWIAALGARYRVEPEFFRRHREFAPSTGFYDIPVLPSDFRPILSLPYTSIYKRQLSISPHAVRKSRENANEISRQHQQDLGTRGIDGESIVRRFAFLDETHFTVEQCMTCCIKKRGSGWQGRTPCQNGRRKCP